MYIDDIEMTNEEALEEMSNLPTEGLNEELEEGSEEAESEEQENETPETDNKPKEGGEEEEEQVPFHKNPRFKQLVDEKNDLKSEVVELKAQIDKLSEEKGSQPEDVKPPKWWTNMYGDGEDSEEAWKEKQLQDKAEREQLRDQIKQDLLNEQKAKEDAFKSNEQWLNDQLNELTESGAKFDKNELFAVIDEFQPTREDGKYDFKKAYRILELQKKAEITPKANARKKLADDTSKGSEKSDKDYKTPADFTGGW